MKIVRILALTLIIALGLMGAGYAYWTDTLTINNSVSTGEFNVDFMKEDGYPKMFGRTNEQYLVKSLEQNDNTVSISVGNMYPDSYVRYELKMKNTGTIPAVFKNAEVVINEDQDGFTNALKAQVFVTKHHKDGSKYQVGEEGYWAGRSLGYKSVSNLETNLNTIMAGLRLEPGEFITFDVPDEFLEEYLAQNPDANAEQCVEILLPGTVGTDENPNEFETANATFDITINWQQHNAQ